VFKIEVFNGDVLNSSTENVVQKLAGFNSNSVVTGISNTLVTKGSSPDTFDMIVFDPGSSSSPKVWYFKVDLTLTSGTATAVLLFTGINVRESVFVGTDTETINGLSIPQSYSAGYAGTLSYSGGTFGSDASKPMGILLPSLRKETCLTGTNI